MDIEKLEKLSCLKIKDSDRANIEKSLEGVFNMMSQLEKIEMFANEKQLEKNKTTFREENFDGEISKIKTEQKIDGLHIEEGRFLAPKVIKK
jgi:Asp-tRNA(Asn)/Glu-tRNA(Gln) amidotransferase C subunit